MIKIEPHKNATLKLQKQAEKRAKTLFSSKYAVVFRVFAAGGCTKTASASKNQGFSAAIQRLSAAPSQAATVIDRRRRIDESIGLGWPGIARIEALHDPVELGLLVSHTALP